jgi:hypothetical protein
MISGSPGGVGLPGPPSPHIETNNTRAKTNTQLITMNTFFFILILLSTYTEVMIACENIPVYLWFF